MNNLINKMITTRNNEIENLTQLANGTFNLDNLIIEIKKCGIKSWDLVNGLVEIILKNENDNSATESECKKVFISPVMKSQLRDLELI